MLSDEERAVLKTAKENYGLTSAEQKILVNLIEKQSKEIEELFAENQSLKYTNGNMIHKDVVRVNYTSNDKIKAKIERKFLEAKGLYERGVQPQAQYTMKLLRDLEESLLEKE